jgi:beta-lactamase superfamily II metal-dependent hydrolase
MADTILIRMYDVGFGDCFLVELPNRDRRPFRILVDCGAHKAGYPRPGWQPEKAVHAIVDDLEAAGDPNRLDIVVATHRHQDHVSGFDSALWRDVDVAEVWMPWTEDPDDERAAVIRQRQSRLALGLHAAFEDRAFAARWADESRADALRAIAANSLTNEDAMRTLHRGFAGRPVRRFLASGDTLPTGQATCPGLTVHVLGPSKDEKVIRDMDPPSGQSYLRHLAASADDAVAPACASRTPRPFAGNFSIAPDKYENGALGPVADPKVKDAATKVMRDDDFAAAVSLDKAVNGTSLMLMLEFRGAFLLFPGDAQWGTWAAALHDPTTRDLLARTTFYKVGHHGSHNATPVEFVKRVLPQNTRIWGAAVSVHPVQVWPEIPRTDLLTALSERVDHLVRSDKPTPIPNATIRDGIGVDLRIPVAD